MPSSCNRTQPRDVSSADSLSRAFSATFPIDTLQFIDTVQPGQSKLAYPRTIAYSPEGILWVTDTAQHIVLTLSPEENNLVARDTLPETYPYMAGFRGSSAYVFSPAKHHMYEMDSTGVLREIELKGSLPGKGGLRYATVTDSGFAIKVVAKGFEGYVAETNDTGEITSSHPLVGEEWRYAGQLRTENQTIYSLAGYLPMMDVFEDSRQDSLHFMGFDSPMLPRTRQFQMGDTKEPPLLSASAVLADSSWFVLNMRPGWIQVDVYSREGTLRHILTQPSPSFNLEFFPTDIAVHPDGTGGYYIAVALIKPDPRIDRFYWHP